MIMIKSYPFSSDKPEKKDPLKSKNSFILPGRYYGKIIRGKGKEWEDPPKMEDDNKLNFVEDEELDDWKDDEEDERDR